MPPVNRGKPTVVILWQRFGEAAYWHRFRVVATPFQRPQATVRHPWSETRPEGSGIGGGLCESLLAWYLRSQVSWWD